MLPTAERAADIDANGPHVGLVRITDAVVEGDEDAEGGKQQTQDQQEHSQGMQDYIDTSYWCQRRNHYTHTRRVQEHNGYMELTCIILFYNIIVVQATRTRLNLYVPQAVYHTGMSTKRVLPTLEYVFHDRGSSFCFSISKCETARCYN